jgi:hypothetical protein
MRIVARFLFFAVVGVLLVPSSQAWSVSWLKSITTMRCDEFRSVKYETHSVPWTMPGDFLERLRISDLVISGTIESSSPRGLQIVNGETLNANIARLRVDRVFQGKAAQEVQFSWFTIHWDGTSGYGYSGPALANFQTRKRYLVFLKRNKSDWTVAMPVYALEVELAPESSFGSLRDLSEALPEQRYEAIAQELETAALSVPPPPPGMTGEAAAYFPSIFDLLGACADPFYRLFVSSPSPELRREALRWLNLIGNRHMTCKTAVVSLK